MESRIRHTIGPAQFRQTALKLSASDVHYLDPACPKTHTEEDTQIEREEETERKIQRLNKEERQTKIK